jgi:hypothetical protein
VPFATSCKTYWVSSDVRGAELTYAMFVQHVQPECRLVNVAHMCSTGCFYAQCLTEWDMSMSVHVGVPKPMAILVEAAGRHGC